MRLIAYAFVALHALIAFGTLSATQFDIPAASSTIAGFLLCVGVADLLVGVFAGIVTSRRDLTVLAILGLGQLAIGAATLHAQFAFSHELSAVIVVLLAMAGSIWMVLGNLLKKAVTTP